MNDPFSQTKMRISKVVQDDQDKYGQWEAASVSSDQSEARPNQSEASSEVWRWSRPRYTPEIKSTFQDFMHNQDNRDVGPATRWLANTPPRHTSLVGWARIHVPV